MMPLSKTLETRSHTAAYFMLPASLREKLAIQLLLGIVGGPFFVCCGEACWRYWVCSWARAARFPWMGMVECYDTQRMGLIYAWSLYRCKRGLVLC